MEIDPRATFSTHVQPTKATMITCSIAGTDYHTLVNGEYRENFHVQELRIYEDNCKFYFTGQLIIEAQYNTFERYLAPQADVVIAFVAPPGRLYQEVFKVYSYESKPREGDIQGSMVVTIALMGKEYFKDKASQVQKNFQNVTGTTAASEIHKHYLSENGKLAIIPESLGMIGKQLHAHQVLSKQPSKAINDLLDKSIFPTAHSGPGVYFRNKPGYIIGALEHLIKTQPITGRFKHFPAAGADLIHTFEGYSDVIHFRPMAPPGEDRGGARNEASKKVLSSLDFKTGKPVTGKGEGGSGYAEGVSTNFTDELRQEIGIDKQGPGNHQAKENAFISKLTYSPKYWVSVPMQEGIKVTVGDNITVRYPVSDEIQTKTLWVARLIHELRFTEGKDRSVVTVTGTTDLFGVYLA